MSDPTTSGQVAAPPGGRLLAVAKRGAEHLLWGRVAIQRRLEARAKGGRPAPTTVPPTAALCREIFGEQGTIVFGWVFAAHQIGAALAAFGAGVIRDTFGAYTWAWWGGAMLCVIASVLSFAVRREPVVEPQRERMAVG